MCLHVIRRGSADVDVLICVRPWVCHLLFTIYCGDLRPTCLPPLQTSLAFMSFIPSPSFPRIIHSLLPTPTQILDTRPIAPVSNIPVFYRMWRRRVDCYFGHACSFDDPPNVSQGPVVQSSSLSSSTSPSPSPTVSSISTDSSTSSGTETSAQPTSTPLPSPTTSNFSHASSFSQDSSLAYPTHYATRTTTST